MTTHPADIASMHPTGVKASKVVYHTARIIEGFIFGVLGLNGFVPFIPAPPAIPPMAMQFFGAIVLSHYAYFVFGVQVLAGILLLANRYVLLAMILLGAVITNVMTYHITMWPAAIVPMPILVTILWFILAWSIRSQFAAIFARRATID